MKKYMVFFNIFIRLIIAIAIYFAFRYNPNLWKIFQIHGSELLPQVIFYPLIFVGGLYLTGLNIPAERYVQAKRQKFRDSLPENSD